VEDVVEELQDRTYDTIVVGSGPGGGTVARELSRRGERVLILERGPNRPISGTLRQALREAMMPGRSLLLTPQLLAVIRGITAGGSSVFYYATACEPPTDGLRKHGIDISREVDEIRSELPTAPLADELIGPVASRIMDSARDLGHDWQPLPKFVHQDLCRADCDRCTFGCPHGAKWNARFFIGEAVEHGAVFQDRARVTRVVVEDGVATGVEAVVGGHWERFSASKVVVSAGGIGTPMILRASGIAGAGRDFFFDPLVVVMGVVDDLSGGREFPMATGLHDADEGYFLTDLVWPRLLYQVFAAEVLRLNRLLSHARVAPIMVKIRDELGGRLTRTGGVRKPLSDVDRRRLARGSERAARILERAGAREIFSTWRVASHPGGTAKVGDIVDADLRTEVDHLYVCDCSVIPEEWGLPPTFTIIALGKRLASHLSGDALEA
jgi:choline dehydrogenase-like flavoprotein